MVYIYLNDNVNVDEVRETQGDCRRGEAGSMAHKAFIVPDLLLPLT